MSTSGFKQSTALRDAHAQRDEPLVQTRAQEKQSILDDYRAGRITQHQAQDAIFAAGLGDA